MKIFGIIGGIGSGKSTAASLFRQCGVPVIDADMIGHGILLLQEVKEVVRQRWGESVFDTSGAIDRRKLAAAVFTDANEREYLQSLTHPLIAAEVQRQRETYRQSGAAMCLLDAPLLLESNWDKEIDGIIFVDAPPEVRRSRVLARGWTEQEWQRREAAQLPVEEKRRRSNIVLDNSDDQDTLAAQIKNVVLLYGSATLAPLPSQ